MLNTCYMLYILVFTHVLLSFWMLHEIWRCIGVVSALSFCVYRSAITSIPSFLISLSRKGLRCWCFRIISTGQPRRASRYDFRRTIRKNLGAFLHRHLHRCHRGAGFLLQNQRGAGRWCRRCFAVLRHEMRWGLCILLLFSFLISFFKGFCPYRAQGRLRLYPGWCPGLGASAPSGRVGARYLKYRCTDLAEPVEFLAAHFCYG